MPIDQDAFHNVWGTGGVAATAADGSSTRVLDPKAFDSVWLTEPPKEKTKPEQRGAIAEGAANIAGGFGHGVMDVANSAAQGTAYLTNHVTKFLTDRGIWPKSEVKVAQNRAAALDQNIAQGNKDYEAAHGNSWLASGGRLVGNVVASAPALAVAGEGIPALGVAALSRFAPSVAAKVAPYAGNLLTRLGVIAPVEGAIGGGTVAASTSAANNEPIGDQVKHGALVGGLLGPAGPLAYEVGKYGGNAIRGIVAPFTEKGQQKLANNAVTDLAASPRPQVSAHEIIPGSKPTLAEASADPGIATIQRQARDLNPAPFVAQEVENNAARVRHLNSVTGTPQDVVAAQSALDAQATNAVSTLFKPGQRVDTAPIVSEIDNILSGAGGKRDAVQTVLSNVRSKLVNKDGSLESNPEVVYNSVRKQIGDLLDKKADSSAGQQAQRELIQVRDVLDDRMTRAVPGFKDYLTDYSSAAKPIESMRYLQGLNLTDSKGNITLAKVDNAIKSIDKQRQAGGVNPAKSLDQGHLDALHDLRDDLLRASHTQLGISKGSPTFQNIATSNAMQSILPGRVGALTGKIDPTLAGGALGTFLGAHMGGPIPAFVGSGVGTYLGHAFGDMMKGKNAQVMRRVEDLLLNPQSFNPSVAFKRGQNLPVQNTVSNLIGATGQRLIATPAVNQPPQ